MTVIFNRARIAAWQVKAPQLANSRVICGLASTFERAENADSHGEIVNPRAFDRSIKRHTEGKLSLKMLWQHGEPIGVWSKIEARSDGLYVEGEILETATGDDALALIKGGAVDALSIGFSIPQGGWREAVEDNDIIELMDIDLLEVSLVTWGSNQYARITETRSIRSALATGKRNNNKDNDTLTACASALSLILKMDLINAR